MGPSREHPKKGCTTIYEKPCQDALSLACVMQAPSTAHLIKEETEIDRVSMTTLFAVWLWTRHLPSLILQSYSTTTVLLSPTLKSTVPGAYKYKQPNFFYSSLPSSSLCILFWHLFKKSCDLITNLKKKKGGIEERNVERNE